MIDVMCKDTGTPLPVSTQQHLECGTEEKEAPSQKPFSHFTVSYDYSRVGNK